ncbi:hypothetical protein ACN47E_001693 [Coniothyrium glycines]
MVLDDAQKDTILRHANRLLSSRDYPKTICPSEIARALSRGELDTLDAAEWRDTMDDIRQVMWEKRECGEVEIMQKGEVVGVTALEDIRGPIRVRLHVVKK